MMMHILFCVLTVTVSMQGMAAAQSKSEVPAILQTTMAKSPSRDKTVFSHQHLTNYRRRADIIDCIHGIPVELCGVCRQFLTKTVTRSYHSSDSDIVTRGTLSSFAKKEKAQGSNLSMTVVKQNAICHHGNNRRFCRLCLAEHRNTKNRTMSNLRFKSALCQHNRTLYSCAICGGSGICVHGTQRGACACCGGNNVCQHGVMKYYCTACGGKGICEHRNNRYNCKRCKGKGMCEHGRRRRTCKECGGAGICEHDRLRYFCKACKGGGICPHDKYKTNCKTCSGEIQHAGRCLLHNRLIISCKECNIDLRNRQLVDRNRRTRPKHAVSMFALNQRKKESKHNGQPSSAHVRPNFKLDDDDVFTYRRKSDRKNENNHQRTIHEEALSLQGICLEHSNTAVGLKGRRLRSECPVCVARVERQRAYAYATFVLGKYARSRQKEEEKTRNQYYFKDSYDLEYDDETVQNPGEQNADDEKAFPPAFPLVKQKATTVLKQVKRSKDGRKLCEHGRQEYNCRPCGGGGICHHNRQRSSCKECKGSSICQHSKMRSQCFTCFSAGAHQKQTTNDSLKSTKSRIVSAGHTSQKSIFFTENHTIKRGGGFCEHERLRKNCVICGGSDICKHNKRRYYCVSCRGKGICQHLRQRYGCRQCEMEKETNQIALNFVPPSLPFSTSRKQLLSTTPFQLVSENVSFSQRGQAARNHRKPEDDDYFDDQPQHYLQHHLISNIFDDGINLGDSISGFNLVDEKKGSLDDYHDDLAFLSSLLKNASLHYDANDAIVDQPKCVPSDSDEENVGKDTKHQHQEVKTRRLRQLEYTQELLRHVGSRSAWRNVESPGTGNADNDVQTDATDAQLDAFAEIQTTLLSRFSNIGLKPLHRFSGRIPSPSAKSEIFFDSHRLVILLPSIIVTTMSWLALFSEEKKKVVKSNS